jgi:DNA-binding CsgD family transcriptional regulator
MSNRRFIDPEVVLARAFAISGPLSVREGDILDLIGQGRSNKEIARSLCIAPETVKTHVKHIFVKLNVEKRAQAVSRAYSLGLVGAYHNTTNRLGSPRVWNVEEPNAGFLPPLARVTPKSLRQQGRKQAGPSRRNFVRVNSNGAIDTRGEEVSDLSASAVIRRSGMVDNICGVAVAW